MGIEALTHDSSGNPVVPTTSAEWDEWVSPSATRNHMLDDPLLDWLDRYGEDKGFVRDPVDDETDFLTFLFAKGNAFEAAVVEHLRGLAELRTIVPEGATREQRHDLAFAEATFAAMAESVPIICQGLLRDAETRTYGGPDLLVRSDVLAKLFPGSLSAAEAAVPADDLGGSHHYRVVDIKFSTLHLAAGGELGNSGSAPTYKAQVFIYNRALGRLQGYLPPEAFVLGRGWEQTKRGDTTRVPNCMDRIAPVANDYASYGRGRLSDQVEQAVEWVRRMRREGGEWQVLPEPTVEELRPNAKGDAGRWGSAVKEIVKQSEDLTQLWFVGVGKRREANREGITRWSDPRVTPRAVAVEGRTTAPRLQALLDVNRDPDGPAVRPAHIAAARPEWLEEAPVEFYVDFETVGDLDDDFSRIPERGGQPLIFMVGCGHVEAGAWRFECFITDRLDEASEGKVIDDWFEHMTAVRDRLAPGVAPHVIHWSPHETITLETAFDAAVKRHRKTRWRHTQKGQEWPHPNWFDFLKKVVREEPVVVRGAHGFGLKAVTNAMHALALVETSWGEGPVDGLGAMVGAWTCEREAARTGGSMRDLPLMGGIRAYNEVDCKAMMELVRYLRRHH